MEAIILFTPLESKHYGRITTQQGQYLTGFTDSAGLLKLCGLSILRRNLYLLRSRGIRRVNILTQGKVSPSLEGEIKKAEKLGMRLRLVKAKMQTKGLSSIVRNSQEDNFLVIDDNCVFDPAFLESLLQHKGTTLCCDGHPEKGCAERSPKILSKEGMAQKIGDNLANGDKIYAGMALCERKTLLEMEDGSSEHPDWPICLNKILKRKKISCLDISLALSYSSELRQSVKPFWYRVNSKEDLKFVKKHLIEGTQKKTLDVLAWYVHRPIEKKITYYLSELPITPNQLTILTNALAFFITFLFLSGHLLIASPLALLVNILDGLDGKQARAKGIITRVGNLEHTLDTLYEQSWYIAFSWALFTITGSLLPLGLCLVMLLFDTFSRHCSMQFRMVMNVPLADYAKFDRAFRRFDGRRNIYTLYILLGVLLGFPLYSLFAMTLHAIVTGVIYFIRSAKHMQSADVGGQI